MHSYIILLHLTSGAEVVRMLHTSNCIVFQVMSNAVSMIPWGSIWFYVSSDAPWSMSWVLRGACQRGGSPGSCRIAEPTSTGWSRKQCLTGEPVKHGETIRLVRHGSTSPVTSVDKKNNNCCTQTWWYKNISRISNKCTLTQTHCLNVDIELLML